MPRNYQLKKRAETQEQTRRQIVEAAVALHCEVGPARTTVSAIAERAGVERHTYYRHFPDERSLLQACSSLHFELQPMPDPDLWREIGDPRARLRRGLTELYDYYAADESLLANVIRDAQVHEVTAETMALRIAPHMAKLRAVLAEGIVAGPRERQSGAALDLALAFPTWQALVRRSDLRPAEAVDLMVHTVFSAAAGTDRAGRTTSAGGAQRPVRSGRA